MTALMVASYKGDTKMVNLLAKAGADVNQQSVARVSRRAVWVNLVLHIFVI
jgi:ankyrin repeat protein